VHGRQRHPVCNAVIDYQRLTRRRGTTAVAMATEDGEAAVAHHASAAGVTLSTHRGERSPAPCCIRVPLLRRPPHLCRRRLSTDAPRADDAPIRQPPRRWMSARVEKVRLLRTRTGGQIYQLHRRRCLDIFIKSSQ
jgi:hypothetical protein